MTLPTADIPEPLLDYRIERLEGDVREVRSELHLLRSDIAEIKGKIGQLPTSWHLCTVFATQFLGMIGALIVVAKFY